MTKLQNRYELGKKIGEGAMGEVYSAFDTQTERTVAIKMLPENVVHPRRRERFKREARTVAKLEHPFVVPLYDFSLSEEDDTEPPFLVMRYMTGGSLADRIQQGRLPRDEVVTITRRIGQALDEAHTYGLVHRDVKPANILLDQNGYAYLADFGIVKDSGSEEHLTEEGQPGTAPYMSPEQVLAKELDGRSDIYALGVVVFEMLTGTLPYGGNNVGVIFQGHVHEPIPSVFSRINDLPDEVDEILRKALAKNPNERFRKAEHLARLLEAALQSPTAYMTSRAELVRTQEETFDTESGPASDAAPGNHQVVADTAPSPVMPQTVDSGVSRRWQLAAGGLGVMLLVVIALFVNSLRGVGDVEPTAVPFVTISVAGNDSPGRTADLALPTATAEPTPIPEYIVVLQQADSAIWQQEDELQRIPENGRVPFQLPLMFQSSNEPVRLLLPNLVSIILDTNSTVWIEAAAPDDETVLRLMAGRLLIESQLAMVRVYHEEGLQAIVAGGSLGVAYDEASEEWAVDCLAGVCEFGQEGAVAQVPLAEGQYSVILPDAVITTPSPARYNAYTSLAQTIPEPTATPTTSPTVTPSVTPAFTATLTPLPTFNVGFRGPETVVLGQSAGGNEIPVIRLGNGPKALLLVGGIHSGFAPNSVELLQELATFFSQNLEIIPDDVSLYLIPNINPDAIVAPGELVGRLNANGVDLNRNWDCRWLPDALILGEIVPGSGGTKVFSEPETLILKSFIEQIEPQAVLFWEVSDGKNGEVSPGACEVRSLSSVALVQYYANATGYDYVKKPEVLANFELTGDVTNWLDKIGIPAIFILLPHLEQYDFQLELQGVLSVLTAVAAPVKIQQTPTPVNCNITINPAWVETYSQHRLQLGCPTSEVKQPTAVWQSFANGRMLWRQDTDQVYVLYDDRSVDTFVVDSPSLAGFEVSELVKGAIGYVYDTYSDVSSKIGPPEDQERQAADVTIQDFSFGFIISWQESGLQTNLIFLGANQWQTP